MKFMSIPSHIPWRPVMLTRISLALLLAGVWLLPSSAPPLPACCPAPPSGKPVVNADQTVILIWDPWTKTEHFIRKASFKSEADDFGFLIPSPSQPELAEAGNEAFPFLATLTAPEVIPRARPSRGMSCGCGYERMKADTAAPKVSVLEEKE